jgi:hypothetical protein
VARHIFQACPVWIYTQSNITQASYKLAVEKIVTLFLRLYGNQTQSNYIDRYLLFSTEFKTTSHLLYLQAT